MDNVPDRYKTLVPDRRSAELLEVYKIGTANALEFQIPYQDYTIGHILRKELLAMPQVTFAGMKTPHPLESKIVIRLQTNASAFLSDTIQAIPENCFQSALTKVTESMELLKKTFTAAVDNYDVMHTHPGSI